MRKYFLPLSILIFTSAVGVTMSYFLGNETSQRDLASYVRGHIVINRDVLDQYYRERGGAALVADAMQAGSNITLANYHSLGHSVGEILFRHEGLGAVATCGDSFEWGCLHQVMGRAFSMLGTSTISTLIETCDSYSDEMKKAQCQHGLGHGIMYMGKYDDGKLNDMMDECDTITTVRPIPKNNSCHAGLMMEYNMHYMTMEYEGENGRPADKAHPFAVCDELKSQSHKVLCVWWALTWLHAQFFDNRHTPEAFHGLGQLCNTLVDDTLKKTCFESIGRSNGVNGNKPPLQALQLCEAATTDLRLRTLCLERTVKAYMGAGNSKDAREICSLAKEEFPVTCDADR